MNTMDLEPWNLINKLYPDLVLVVEGKKLYYHQAVLAQHSALIKSLLLKSGCCKCKGEDCRRSNENIFISLGEVKISTVQYVMDIIYAGSGNMAGDTEEYKKVLEMLKIDTVAVDTLDAPEGFIFQEICDAPLSLEENILALPVKNDKGRMEYNNIEVKNYDDAKKSDNKYEEAKKKRREREEEKRKRKREISSVDENATTSTKTLSKNSIEGDNPGVTVASAEVQQEVNDEEIEIIGDSSDGDAKSEVTERFSCPFKDCSSESRTAQSIKVHLALVHYKKTIQAEYPNWRTQKCLQCDRGFGQMTAYYLHMAQHRKYPHMESSPSAARPSRPPGPPGPQVPSISTVHDLTSTFPNARTPLLNTALPPSQPIGGMVRSGSSVADNVFMGQDSPFPSPGPRSRSFIAESGSSSNSSFRRVTVSSSTPKVAPPTPPGPQQGDLRKSSMPLTSRRGVGSSPMDTSGRKHDALLKKLRGS